MARIDIGKDSNGEDKNDIRQAVTRDHKEYAAATAGNAHAPAYAPPQPSYAAPAQQSAYVAPQPQQPAYAPPAPSQAPQHAAPAPAAGVRPTWAK